MKEEEFEFHRENEKVEKWNRSKRNGLNAIALPRLLLRGSGGTRRVNPEELRCPKRIGHRSCLEIK